MLEGRSSDVREDGSRDPYEGDPTLRLDDALHVRRKLHQHSPRVLNRDVRERLLLELHPPEPGGAPCCNYDGILPGRAAEQAAAVLAQHNPFALVRASEPELFQQVDDRRLVRRLVRVFRQQVVQLREGIEDRGPWLPFCKSAAAFGEGLRLRGHGHRALEEALDVKGRDAHDLS